jgi:hypothetical protein
MIPIIRHATEIKKLDDKRGYAPNSPVELADTRDDFAYVLLGDPGLGKTTVFKQETGATRAVFVSARDFLVMSYDREGCAEKTFFIDALDETRAGVQDGRTVLDQIRSKLIVLGVPRFRLSCREADWLGSSDRDALSTIVHGRGELRVYRLEPLSDADIATLLKDQFHVGDPQQFVRHAEQMGVGALLRNPQTLRMLAKAVSSGTAWPNSRSTTFELACKTLATEPNQEHQSAKKRSWPNTTALLDAAGLVSAVFLCADRSEIALVRAETSDPKALVLLEIGNDRNLPIQEAIETNLFIAIGENVWMPAHRSIAEFLAARYIAQLITSGLPPARATSLMLGADAGVITSLRGLNAWVASCSTQARDWLVEADPQGVLLYGDTKAFATHEKVRLLECLKQRVADGQWRSRDDWNSHALGALATQDMADEFVKILRAPGRERADQALADLVVTALSRGPTIVGVGAALIETARDASRWSGMRRYALRSYLNNYLESDVDVVALFDDVAKGRVVDDDDALLGILLTNLYPRRLSIAGALEHLRPPKAPNSLTRFKHFWCSIFLPKTETVRLPELLDALSARTTLDNQRGNEIFWSVAGESLVRGLEELGDDTDDESLHSWLGITLGEYVYDHLDRELRARLHAWLEQRPARFLRLLRVAIKHLKDDERLWRALRRLHEPKWPPHISQQLLALADSETRMTLAEDLFWCATRSLYEPENASDLTFEKLQDWVVEHPRFATVFEQFRYWKIDDWRIENAAQEAEERREKHDLIAQYREALLAKPAAEFNIQGLHHLALASAGILSEANGETPDARLRDFLGGDEILVAKAIEAIDATYLRTDLPTAHQVLTSYLSNKEWLLAQPLLVSLDRLVSAETSTVFRLPEPTLRAALMASYAGPLVRDSAFRKLLAIDRPSLVADVFSSYAIAALKAGESSITGAQELVDDTAFAAVAAAVLPDILGRFPQRASLDQLHDLARFIKSFASIFTAKAVLELVAAKVALKVLDVGQRTYWLATGLLLAPKKYEKHLRTWAEGNEIRIGHLGDFLDRRDQGLKGSVALPVSAISTLIELLAPHSRPDRPEGMHRVTAEMQRGDLIASWIHELATSPFDAAKAELMCLGALPALAPWAHAIRSAAATQTIVQRDANYRFPTPEQVVATLSQGAPANAADLHALVVENLQHIATDIARSDLDIYKQYWNTDSHNCPLSPKVEEAGRDALCVLLRERLAKHQVSFAPEARHVDQKRSDILCAHQFLCVPIEVKHQMHPQIWKAIRDQLSDQYTIDPRTGGYGIYLVFWFGPNHKLVSPHFGRTPKTATELKVALQSTLLGLQQKMIAICVIDVSLEGRRG